MHRSTVLSALLVAILPFGVAAQPGIVVLNKSEASASLISLADGRIIATMPVGAGPHEVAVSPDGKWAVAANYSGPPIGHTLTVLDLKKRQSTATIELDTYLGPHGIAWLPDGKRVIVSSERTNSLVIVDVAGGKVDRVIQIQQPVHLFTLATD